MANLDLNRNALAAIFVVVIGVLLLSYFDKSVHLSSGDWFKLEVAGNRTVERISTRIDLVLEKIDRMTANIEAVKVDVGTEAKSAYG